MGFRQQHRQARPESARRIQFQPPEVLESRQLLSTALPGYYSLYTPSDLYVTNPITNQRISYSARNLMQHNNPNSPLLSNQGKVVSGTDRNGTQWTITVHGPGQVIVTDTTPGDGSLDDDIATIQIINSNPNTTYVTGTTVASNRVLTDGTVNFNRLIAVNGVKSIVLNGFNLDANVTPAVAQSPGIFLYGGVGTLKFNDINAMIDTSQSSTPYQIVIGDPSTPLKVQPSITIDSIYNSVFDSSTISSTPPTGPLTTPSVIFSVNGVVKNFSLVSITQSAVSPNYVSASQNGTLPLKLGQGGINYVTQTSNPVGLQTSSTSNWTGVPISGPIIPAGGAYQFEYSVVGTTGRTTLQALAVKNLKVAGKATNFTAQRDTTPFTSSLSGLKYLRKATFGGNADAVALNVSGPIGKLTFRHGLGNPTSVFTGKVAVPIISQSQTQTYQYTPATSYGAGLGSEGYPAHGLLGGTVTATRIKSLKVGPANYVTQTAQNPALAVTLQTATATPYLTNPGTALTNSAITTSGSINSVKVTGNQVNSEIKTGFDYASYLAGLEATRAASRIARLKQRGDLVNSVDSATFRAAANSSGQTTYSNSTGTAGPGAITGTSTIAVGHGIYASSHAKHLPAGSAYNTGGRTALGNYGAGFYARKVSRGLPPGKSG
jgi:hypothetical protein